MPESLIIELGRCGVGHDKGPPRLLRLGILQIAFAPRGLIAQLSRQELVLSRCRRVLWIIARRAVDAKRAASTVKTPAIIAVDESFMSALDDAMADLEPGSTEGEA